MRFRPVVAFLLAGLVAAPLVGCSRKAEKVVGAGRVIRGPGGLGTTVHVAPNADRDTYVEPGTADFSEVLIVGDDTLFSARTFLAVSSWKLPDTTLAGFFPDTVFLRIPRDTTLADNGSNVSLFTTASRWDTTTVAWPGPGSATLLGSAPDARPAAGTFSLPLTAAAFDSIKRWALAPATSPGFVLVRPGQGPLAYRAGAALFRVRYTHLVSGRAVLDSIDSPVTQDFYLHSPISPAPTGTDPTLILGGLYKAALALHFPVDSIPSGVSIDEATLVLKITAGGGPQDIDAGDVIQVRRIRNPWSESITEKSGLTIDDATSASFSLTSTYSSADSLVTLRIPGALLREWSATSSSNEGLYVSLINPVNRRKDFRFGSRESAHPPEIRISYTGLPPGRF